MSEDLFHGKSQLLMNNNIALRLLGLLLFALLGSIDTAGIIYSMVGACSVVVSSLG
jgi:hypothetical protein